MAGDVGQPLAHHPPQGFARLTGEIFRYIHLNRTRDAQRSFQAVRLGRQFPGQIFAGGPPAAQVINHPARIPQSSARAFHRLLHNGLGAVGAPPRQMGIHRLQLQNQPGQPLSQGVVQLAGHALALAAQGQILNLRRVVRKLAVGLLQLRGQFLGAFARLGLAAVEGHIHAHKDRQRQHHQRPKRQLPPTQKKAKVNS